MGTYMGRNEPVVQPATTERGNRFFLGTGKGEEDDMSARSVGRLKLFGALVLLLALGLLVGCAGGGQEEAAAQEEEEGEEHNVYFGWLLGTSDIVAVAFDVGPLDEEGARDVRAYVCDGLGPPDGMAIWFRGPVSEETVNQLGESESLTSAGGQETLLIEHLDDNGVSGAFTGADGERHRFDASPAQSGAGIYAVTVNEDRSVSGTSTDGLELEAQIDEEGNVEATISSADGQEIVSSRGVGLAFASAADLAERGLPTTYRQFGENTFVPGEYVAVISPGSRYWLGRSGNVRGGTAGNNIIGLDKAC